MSDHTAADTDALDGGARSLASIGYEVRALHREFTRSVVENGDVFGTPDGPGSRARSNEFVEIWNESVKPGEESAKKILDDLKGALEGVGLQTGRTARELEAADEGAAEVVRGGGDV